MAVDDRARQELLTRLEDVLGSGAADTLMNHLPPGGWAELATKTDLDLSRSAAASHVTEQITLLRLDLVSTREGLRGEMAGLREGLRGEMAGLREELRGEMVELREELRGEMVELREELRGEMAGLREGVLRSQRQLVTWLAGVVVAANSVLVGLVVAVT